MKPLDQSLVDWANAYLDNDAHQRAYEQLGISMYQTFGAERGRISSQVRNLQSIANSAVRYSDVELFIKNQMGRDGAVAPLWRRLTPSPLSQLRQIADATTAADMPSRGDSTVAPSITLEQQLPLRLLLLQGWVRAVTAGYLFARSEQLLNEACGVEGNR